MITVNVSTGTGMSKNTGVVQVHGFDKLTPKAARAALEIAGFYIGSVHWTPPMTAADYEAGMIPEMFGYGYRVYRNSARKINS